MSISPPHGHLNYWEIILHKNFPMWAMLCLWGKGSLGSRMPHQDRQQKWASYSGKAESRCAVFSVIHCIWDPDNDKHLIPFLCCPMVIHRCYLQPEFCLVANILTCLKFFCWMYFMHCGMAIDLPQGVQCSFHSGFSLITSHSVGFMVKRMHSWRQFIWLLESN